MFYKVEKITLPPIAEWKTNNLLEAIINSEAERKSSVKWVEGETPFTLYAIEKTYKSKYEITTISWSEGYPVEVEMRLLDWTVIENKNMGLD